MKVIPLAPLSRRESLWVCLFPALVTWGLSFVLYGLVFLTLLVWIGPSVHGTTSYLLVAPWWHLTLQTAAVCLMYGFGSGNDLAAIWRLLARRE